MFKVILYYAINGITFNNKNMKAVSLIEETEKRKMQVRLTPGNPA